MCGLAWPSCSQRVAPCASLSPITSPFCPCHHRSLRSPVLRLYCRSISSLATPFLFLFFAHPSVAMSLLRAAGLAARTVAAAPTAAAARRTAIVATVAKAADTSAVEFSAPSSFDVAASGRRAAKDLRSFFKNGGT